MTNRIMNPASPVRRNRSADWAIRNVRWEALARAESHAATVREQARVARLAAMTPSDRAYELRNSAERAEHAAARLRRELDGRPQVATQRNPVIPSPEAVRANFLNQAVTAANDRVISFHKLGRLAAANGAAFDVDAAIASGMSVESARIKVTDLMADASEALTVHNRTAAHTAEAVNIADGWSAALEKVVARKGLTLNCQVPGIVGEPAAE